METRKTVWRQPVNDGWRIYSLKRPLNVRLYGGAMRSSTGFSIGVGVFLVYYAYDTYQHRGMKLHGPTPLPNFRPVYGPPPAID